MGVNLIFGPQFVLGFINMPRRYVDFPDAIEFLNRLSTVGYFISLVSVIYFLTCYLRGLRSGVYLQDRGKTIRSLEVVGNKRGFHEPLEGLVVGVFLLSI